MDQVSTCLGSIGQACAGCKAACAGLRSPGRAQPCASSCLRQALAARISMSVDRAPPAQLRRALTCKSNVLPADFAVQRHQVLHNGCQQARPDDCSAYVEGELQQRPDIQHLRAAGSARRRTGWSGCRHEGLPVEPTSQAMPDRQPEGAIREVWTVHLDAAARCAHLGGAVAQHVWHVVHSCCQDQGGRSGHQLQHLHCRHVTRRVQTLPSTQNDSRARQWAAYAGPDPCTASCCRPMTWQPACAAAQ